MQRLLPLACAASLLALPWSTGNGQESREKKVAEEIKDKGPQEGVIVEPSKDFTHIHLIGAGKLSIRKADLCGVSVKDSKDQWVTPKILIHGRTLYIVSAGTLPDVPLIPAVGKIELPNLRPALGAGKTPEYMIDVKDLQGITVSGAGTSEVEGIDSKNLTLSIVGTGALALRGAAEKVDVSVNGLGTFEGRYLTTQTMTIRHHGAATAKVHAAKQLNVTVMGSGVVEYRGSPTVRKSILGNGRVVPLKD